jgi:hypothetical protein
MPSPRTRPLQKRACLWVAAVVLLLAGYVSSYFVMYWLMGRETLANSTVLQLEKTVFAPCVVYGRSSLPGGKQFRAFGIRMFVLGTGDPSMADQFTEYLE